MSLLSGGLILLVLGWARVGFRDRSQHYLREIGMIIDCHVHVWELPPIAPVGPTAPSWTAVTDEAGPTELLVKDMDANGVDATVLVQSSGSTWDNTYVAESANADRGRFRSIGLVDPMDPENASGGGSVDG